MRFVIPAILFLSAILCDARLFDRDDGRPKRPDKFETAEQVENYLKELQEYYSVYGRGRYGKRQEHTLYPSHIFQRSPFEYNLREETPFNFLGNK